ncbi:hypothetical protein L596_021715 [Steinernema carpocapsae]|uniref:Uncharacterized protein n=1 Tax=Steinernema carpocapsae TaxID=34508 RepID=A0A4V6A020_STECR|nr:hypothetical protein L596_021715 [Steinernema carpocapsae]
MVSEASGFDFIGSYLPKSHYSLSRTVTLGPATITQPSSPLLFNTVQTQTFDCDCLPQLELADGGKQNLHYGATEESEGRIQLTLERKPSRARRCRKVDKKTREMWSTLIATVVCVAMGMAALYYLWHVVNFVDLERPKDDKQYLLKAQTLDNRFFHRFNNLIYDYLKSDRQTPQSISAKLAQEIKIHKDRHVTLAHVASNVSQEAYRAELAYNVLFQSVADLSSNETNLNNTRLFVSTVGFQRTLYLQKFLTNLIYPPSSSHVENFTKIVDSFDKRIQRFKSCTPATLRNDIDAFWTTYKHDFTPAMRPQCMKTTSNASDLLNKYLKLAHCKDFTCEPKEHTWTREDSIFIFGLAIVVMHFLIGYIVYQVFMWLFGMVNKFL